LQNDHLDVLNSLEDLIGSISGKSELEEIEMEYLRFIAPIIPAHATALYLFKPGKSNPIRISASGVDEDFLTYYETRGRELDPLRGWITKNHGPNQSQVLLGLEGWKKHPVYQVVGTMGIDFAMQAPIISSGEIIGTIDLQVVSIISKFLFMAISNGLSRKEISHYKESLRLTLDDEHQGVFITDSDFTVRYANDTAQKMVIRAIGPENPEKQLSTLVRNGTKNRHAGKIENEFFSGNFFPLPGSQLEKTIVLINEVPSTLNQSILGSLLTKREFEILQLVENGLRNHEIAERLFISVNTVKRHLDNLYIKFDVNSRTEMVAKAYRIKSIC
jgi:DNA-binding CsgD family transcriptional regulator/PAS domain-containing protein